MNTIEVLEAQLAAARAAASQPVTPLSSGEDKEKLIENLITQFGKKHKAKPATQTQVITDNYATILRLVREEVPMRVIADHSQSILGAEVSLASLRNTFRPMAKKRGDVAGRGA